MQEINVSISVSVLTHYILSHGQFISLMSCMHFISLYSIDYRILSMYGIQI